MTTVLPGLDFESFATVDIKKVGAWVYSEHHETEILCFSYDMGNGVQRWRPGMPAPEDLISYVRAGGLMEASNDFFEWAMWENICHKRFGWPQMPLTQWRDMFARARSWSLPGNLETLGDVTDVPVKKDKVGKRIMLKLCKPRNPTKTNPDTRWTRQNTPADYEVLEDYCDDDVITQRQISALLPQLTPTEEQVMLLDKKINARGIYCNRDVVEAAIDIYEQATQKYTAELQAITRDVTMTASKVKEMVKWLATERCYAPDLAKETVSNLLKREDLTPLARRVLEIRQMLSASATKKLYAMQERMGSDDRIRDFLCYCGADGTGRWAGRGIQPQNFPNSGPAVKECVDCGADYYAGLDYCPCCVSNNSKDAEWGAKAMALCIEHIKSRDLNTLETLWGNAIKAISGCLRGMLQSAPGKKLICSDYSAIEARVIAHIAGEQWRLDVFRTHGKIYEMSASKISGISFDDMMQYKKDTGSHHPMRKKIGKPAELGSGYKGWINAWKNFGADKFLSDEEIKDGIIKWRQASPAIVALWDGLEDAATMAILAGMPQADTNAIFMWLEQLTHDDDWKVKKNAKQLIAKFFPVNPGPAFLYNGIYYQSTGEVLYCRLPSGRMLNYHKPIVSGKYTAWGTPSLALSFMGTDQLTRKWCRTDTYAGKLTNNVVQGYARDILAWAMLRLDQRGYPIVMHVHDEVIAEVDDGFGSVEEFEDILRELPPWAAGCPIDAAGGYIDTMYQK